MTERSRPSLSALHRRWAELENEHHELAIAIEGVAIGSADLAPMRERQAMLLLDIDAVTVDIERASITTIEDVVALLDVVLDHETDIAGDIATYGPIDYPMTSQLLRAAARLVPGFEFNSLRRWLSPTQFRELFEPAANDAAPAEPFGFGEPDDRPTENPAT